MFACLDCGSAYVGDALSDEELGRAYGVLDESAYYASIARTNEAKVRRVAERLASLLPADAAIIDVGAGDGALLRVLKAQGFTDLSAHELPGHGAQLDGVASQIYEDYDLSSVPTGRFDLVTMLDVMEHVPSPRLHLEQCWRMLKPGGLLYVHTPTVTQVDRFMQAVARLPRAAGAVGRAWLGARLSIYHLQNYSADGLCRLLSASGFEGCEIAFRNELSWPLHRYVYSYLIRKHGFPAWSSPILTSLIAPILTSQALNANKAIVVARRSLAA